MLDGIKTQAECINLLAKFIGKKIGGFEIGELVTVKFRDVLCHFTLQEGGKMAVEVVEHDMIEFNMSYDEFVQSTIENLSREKRK